MDAPPFAQISGDALGPGRETVTLSTADLAGAVIAVHRFSSGRLGDSHPRIRVSGIQEGSREVSPPPDAGGSC
jgi:hypothetical protein